MKTAKALQQCVVGAASAHEARENTNNGVKTAMGKNGRRMETKDTTLAIEGVEESDNG